MRSTSITGLGLNDPVVGIRCDILYVFRPSLSFSGHSSGDATLLLSGPSSPRINARLRWSNEVPTAVVG